jgi:ribosomal protein S18 acetylase RimI-like enzyme
MSALEIRRVSDGDIDAIAALAKARPHTAKWAARELKFELDRLDSLFLLAEEDGALRGYALARVLDQDCLLLDLAADADGAGRGRALMAALALAAKARGCRRISFEVSASNERGLAFYAKAGAAVVGRRPKFYNDGSDALLMDLDIP